MTKSVDERVHKRLAPLREAGFRPVQIWVADARKARLLGGMPASGPGRSEKPTWPIRICSKVMDAALADTNDADDVSRGDLVTVDLVHYH